MSDPERSIERILHSLQERAKELNCLYRIDEILAHEAPLGEILQSVAHVIPTGWQHPGVCRARIAWKDTTVEAPGFAETAWMQSAPIVVQGAASGRITVVYLKEQPASDEGPFLKEERKLLDTIAERIGQMLHHRELKTLFDRGKQESAPQEAGAPARPGVRPEWWVIVEFLRMTDRSLLRRIARRMINHLAWSGVTGARDLLAEAAGRNRAAAPPDAASADSAGTGENVPLGRATGGDPDALAEAAFEVAAAHLGQSEILGSIQKWIKEDKVAFLATVLETADAPLVEIAEALERFEQLAVDEKDLSLATQIGLKVSLIRRIFTGQVDYIATARRFLDIADFADILRHCVLPPRSRGRLGGKSAGVILAAKIVEKSKEYAAMLSGVRVPRTWYVPSDVLMEFIHHNNLEDVYNWKYLTTDQVRQEYPHLVQIFKSSPFPPDIVRGLSVALDDFGDRPLIVRSSSLLEDSSGAAFSGKYKSLFLANRGLKPERLAALMDAIAEVYASVFGPDPIEYRAERGLLDHHEEMGILIQEVVGTTVGPYFLPAFSGVAFSNNEFRWSPRIRREDGLIRLVPGLGTRAVDRLADDYPVLVAPGQPGLRASVSPDEIARYSPSRIDVINLETNVFETIPAKRLLRDFGDDYPRLGQLVSILEHDRIRQPVGLRLDPGEGELVFTFDGLIASTPFIAQMRSLLSLLRESLGTPVDIEFAYDGQNFYILQCRPQSWGEESTPAPIPRDIPPERVVFTANRYVSNGRVPDLTHLVYVDPEAYGAVGSADDMREVGRIVGRLNKLLPRRQFALMGPGRWGSRGDIRLGVPVTYADINNTAVLVEMARKKGNYVPDLSFGTHFFQDLVEASIRYLPLYPDDPGVRFHEAFLRRSANILEALLPDAGRFAEVIRVIDVPGVTEGLVLRILMNAELQEAVGVLVPPGAVEVTTPVRPDSASRPGESHWRWRLRLAETIAAELDPERFGVKAFYVLGSTKNATAGPASDIDVLLHFAGTGDQRKDLQLWLEGWGLCLGEMNYLRTGYRTGALLDVHLVTDEDIAARTSWASKIGAVTDAARPLPLKDRNSGDGDA